MPRALLVLVVVSALVGCRRDAGADDAPNAGAPAGAPASPLEGTWTRVETEPAPIDLGGSWTYAFDGDTLTITLPPALEGDPLRFAYELEGDTALVVDGKSRYRVRLRGDSLDFHDTADGTDALLVRQR
ncbi:MAG TPA: hypothetical protein VD962_08775 [Rubricoccaceae bacterium]|nr:hypothetical protein [Rubricoccaceae bacterium]